MADFVRVKELDDDNDIDQHYVYLPEDFLGEGSYGQTFRAAKVSNPARRYAIKIQPKRSEFSDDPDEDLLKLFRELLIVNRILPKHPNIIELIDILVSPNQVFIVLELCEGRMMGEFYPDAEDASGRRAFGQLVQAVHTCHEHGVVHWDIKSDNVLFKDREYMELKLIDFGQAVYRPEWASRRHNNFDHTKWFNSEELLPRYDARLSKYRDIKDLGHTLHAILAGWYVLPILTNYTLDTHLNQRIRTDRFDAAAIDLLTKIGTYPIGPENQDEVWTTDQILQHPWISGVPAIALEPAGPGGNLERNLALLQNDLTLLKLLLKEWMVMPMKTIVDDQYFYLHYTILGRVQRGNDQTRVIMIEDAPTQTKLRAMKVIYGRLGGAPDVVMGGYETRPPILVYLELLITLRILPPHAHIINIRDMFVHQTYVLVIRELLWSRHSMNDLFETADEHTSRKIFSQIAETVRLLHRYGVVHMDLHPDHIVFTDDKFTHCQIVNFSRAVYVHQIADLLHENFQPERYVTPQIVQIAAQADVQVDITALGRILHAMMCRTWEPDPRRCVDLWPVLGEFGPAADDLLSKIGPQPHGPAQGDRNITMDEICQHLWVLEQ